jgi:uncharacterized protein (DUF1786 family)
MSEAMADVVDETTAGAEVIAAASTLTDRVRERPLLSLGVASLIGFVMGGGASSRVGAAMLVLAGRIWLRRTATDALTNALTGYGRTKRNGSPGSRTRTSAQ